MKTVYSLIALLSATAVVAGPVPQRFEARNNVMVLRTTPEPSAVSEQPAAMSSAASGEPAAMPSTMPGADPKAAADAMEAEHAAKAEAKEKEHQEGTGTKYPVA
jgi:hypothetical protein